MIAKEKVKAEIRRRADRPAVCREILGEIAAHTAAVANLAIAYKESKTKFALYEKAHEGKLWTLLGKVQQLHQSVIALLGEKESDTEAR